VRKGKALIYRVLTQARAPLKLKRETIDNSKQSLQIALHKNRSLVHDATTLNITYMLLKTPKDELFYRAASKGLHVAFTISNHSGLHTGECYSIHSNLITLGCTQGNAATFTHSDCSF
jgi:hypothetical protein